MASLRDKTISGILWSLLQKIGYRGISFVVMILLARLLAPKAFGLIGMLMIFVQVSQALIEGGFNLALIQKQDTDELDYSSVFWINLVVSIGLYLVVFFCAPLIATFYDQPLLTDLLRSLSIVFVVNSFSIVQEARLKKEMDFKTLTLVHIPSTLIGGGISLIMAFKGLGVWSLVTYQVLNRVAYTIQIWLYAKWKPEFIFQWERIRTLFNYGSKLLLAKVIGVIYDNIFFVFIGKFYPVKVVGYYQNSFSWVSIPSNTMTSVIDNVVFSAFSSIQDDDKKLKNGYRKVIQQVFFWVCPIYVFACILAQPLFAFVLGAQWLPAAPYFQVLCVVAIFLPLNRFNLNIVKVKGRSDVFLKLQILRRGLILVALILVININIWAVLAVQAISYTFAFFLFAYFSGKFINYKLKEQLADILPIFLISITIGTGIYFTNKAMQISDLVRILLFFSVGGGCYLLLAKIFKLEAYTYLGKLLHSQAGRFKNKNIS